MQSTPSSPSSLVSPIAADSSKQSYKLKKEKYHTEKRRVARELLCTFKDPTVVVMADWLKVRGTLRTWTKMYCVLKPGLLLIYKSPKTHKYGYWIGTVLLSTCELIERPSKRDGFCFKLFHPLDQSIWATRGPQGENFGAVTQPLPSSYLICRAACEEAGRCWMDGLELALKCSSLLIRTMNKLQETASSVSLPPPAHSGNSNESLVGGTHNNRSSINLKSAASQDDYSDTHSLLDTEANLFLSETEAEKHFSSVGLGDGHLTDSDDTEEANAKSIDEVEESHYEPSPAEVFGALGDAEQTEEVADENKSLIWTLMKQVRPGMDLSKVVLPTFILEPRSFLEKMADYYYHSDLLTSAVNEDDPFKRMKDVVKFYMSGFYKKPKGLKKPYNPILGEKFRCFWQHDFDKSRTFFVAEQVSHHPPVSAFFASNRKAGFNVAGSILAKSKFYGNSLSAIMIGSARITLLTRGESYLVTLPYAHCKGLILGTLSMELGGSVKIACDRTSYTAELDFKLKPFLSGSDGMNACSGKIKLGKETLADLSGHWDSTMYLTDRQSGETEIFWQPNQESIARRLKRFEVVEQSQEETESQKLWSKVTEAIKNNDQFAATEEKTKVEEAQRGRVKHRAENGEIYQPALFELDHNVGTWLYKHADYRPWDLQNDLEQFERDFMIKTRVKHPTPLVRTISISTSDVTAVNALENLEGTSEEEQNLDTVIPTPTKRRKQKTPLASANAAEVDLAKRNVEELLRPLRQDLSELKSRFNATMFKLDRLTQTLNQATDSLRTQLFIVLAVLVAFQAVVSLFFGSKFQRINS